VTTARAGQLPEAHDHQGCELLRQVVDLTVELGDVRALAGEVAELVRRTTGVDVVFVFVLDDDGRQLALTGATHPFQAAVGTVHLPLGEGVSGWVASHCTPVVLPDGKLDDARWRRFPQLRGEDFVSMASVPLDTSSGEVVGVLNVHTVHRRDWDADDLALLRSTARMVAGAVHTARLLRHLDLRRQEQQDLSARLVDVEEQERARLARELHDGVAQRIAALSFHLSAAQEALPGDPTVASEQLHRAAELVDLTAAETRAAVRALRPPLLDDLGLAAGLHALARDFDGLSIAVSVEPLPLTAVQETALYRIAQEALHNVVKHAGAKRVRLRLRRDGDLAVLLVMDDGCGVLPQPPGSTHGLTSMRDRACLIGADLDIAGRPGQGTTVRVALPL
jgi:signal transduction histidine kinase